jgi:pyridoxal phosphate enzyme (YggS family)
VSETLDVAGRLAALRDRIEAAAKRAGRRPGAVRTIGAAKRQPIVSVAAAVRAGLRDVGENYVQEALAKRAALADALEPALFDAITWHGIGHLQRNKAREAVACFSWLHGVDRAPLAVALSKVAAHEESPRTVLLQLNLSGEASKSGAAEAELPALLDAVRALPHLRVAGLMTMPAPTADPELARPAFAKLRELAARHGLDELSLGMSDDFEVAVEEGATLVRIGSALFGPRDREGVT